MSARTPCTHCGRNSPDAFLCHDCQDDLADMLHGLARGRPRKTGGHEAGWIDHLREAALGQTKLGETARRTPRYRNVLDGERALASHLELLPERHETIEGPALDGQPWPLTQPAHTDLATARRQRQHAVLQRALGTARINLAAAEQLDYTHSVLLEWVRDLCETRKAVMPVVDDTNGLALWLARNISAIAADEGAAICCREIREIIADIERIINRAIPPRLLGPCPAMLARSHQADCALAHPHACTRAVVARHGAREATCGSCGAVHNVEDLIARNLADTDDYLCTMRELIDTALPALREHVPTRTLNEWRRTGKLQPHDYTADGTPRFRLGDVRELRDQRPQTAATGRAVGKEVSRTGKYGTQGNVL